MSFYAVWSADVIVDVISVTTPKTIPEYLPKTGKNHTGYFGLLMLLSGAGLVSVVIIEKRKVVTNM